MLILKEYALSMLEYHLLDPCSDPYGFFTQWIGLILADSLPHSFLLTMLFSRCILSIMSIYFLSRESFGVGEKAIM